MRHALKNAALALVALLTAVPVAHADSLLYIKNGDVWLASPDGAREHRVTLDGSAAAPYRSPSQADDGTIVVARGDRLLRMDQAGRLLNAPIDMPSTPLAPDISPDGRTVAYHVSELQSCGTRVCVRSRTLFAPADRPAGPFDLDDGAGGIIFPSWIDNQRVIATSNGWVWTDTVGPVQESIWWIDPAVSVSDAEVSRAGDRIVLVRGDAGEQVQLYTTQGPPPTPPKPQCYYTLNPGDQSFHDPTFAPDGSRFAVASARGIYVIPTCDRTATPTIVFPGASDPDWSPADVNPPAPAPPGCTTPCPPPPAPCAPCPPPQPTPQTAARLTALTVPKRVRPGTAIRIRFTLNAAARVRVTLHAGPRTVRSAARHAAPGPGTIVLRARRDGRQLTPRRYVVRVTVGTDTRTARLRITR